MFYIIFILVSATVKVNLPFGRPRVTQKNKEHCLLYHREYISGYGKAMKMAMWSSYTLPKPVRSVWWKDSDSEPIRAEFCFAEEFRKRVMTPC